MKSFKNLIFCLMVSGPCFAAIESQVNSVQSTSKELQTRLIESLDTRVSWLKESPTNVLLFERIAFGEQYHLQDRWRALFSLAAVGDERAKKNIKTAVESEDWFMRDAGLKAALNFDKSNINKFALAALKEDGSLIVRTTAVKILHKINATDSESVLWDELNSSKNFRKNQSLWIRKYIVRALVDFQKEKSFNQIDRTKTMLKFAALLNDDDNSFHEDVVKGLNLISGKDKSNKLQLSQADEWKNWLSNQ